MIATTRYYAQRSVHVAITSMVNEQVDPAKTALCGAIVIGYPDTQFDATCADCITALAELEAAEAQATASFRTIRPRKATWFGRRASTTEVRKTSRQLGERVAITTWLDDALPCNGGHKAGTVVARHMKGDGRFPSTFTLFGEATFRGDDAAERATRWAHDALLGRLGWEGPLRDSLTYDCTPARGC